MEHEVVHVWRGRWWGAAAGAAAGAAIFLLALLGIPPALFDTPLDMDDAVVLVQLGRTADLPDRGGLHAQRRPAARGYPTYRSGSVHTWVGSGLGGNPRHLCRWRARSTGVTSSAAGHLRSASAREVRQPLAFRATLRVGRPAICRPSLTNPAQHGAGPRRTGQVAGEPSWIPRDPSTVTDSWGSANRAVGP